MSEFAEINALLDKPGVLDQYDGYIHAFHGIPVEGCDRSRHAGLDYEAGFRHGLERRPSAEDPEPITEVPMVCTFCRQPVALVPGRGWYHITQLTADRCELLRPTAAVRANVAAGQENVPNRSEEK